MAHWSSSLLLLAACKQAPSKLDDVKPSPHAVPSGGPIKIDGELDEPAWNARAHRGVFLDDTGHQARPYSEIRLLAGEHDLYVAVYAADEDIRAADSFQLQLGALAVTVHPDGATEPKLAAAADVDGTVDKPSDDDEEWIVEFAVPYAQLGDATAFSAKRCDTPKDGKPRCGQWSEALRVSALPRR
jgi:hypothetical protein